MADTQSTSTGGLSPDVPRANRPASRTKPAKPSPGYPLTPHASGKWCKRIKGRIHYFGRWEDPDGALREYLDAVADLDAGRPVGAPDPSRFSVRDAVNHFLTACDQKLEAGRIRERTFKDYKLTARNILQAFGKHTPLSDLAPADFMAYLADVSKRRNATSVGNEITRVRTILNWAFKAGHVDSPPKFGPDFGRPPKRVRRLESHRTRSGKKLFTPHEILDLADEVGIHLRAMVFLGINGGFDNSGCAELPLNAPDLDSGWLTYPRPKTGVVRRCPLWPETVDALRASRRRRAKPATKEAAELFFLTTAGHPWTTAGENKISRHIGDALHRLNIHVPGKGYYWLRHTFRTIGEQLQDREACRVIMGHVDNSIDATYIEEFPDARLLAVTNHVRAWLFSAGEEGGAA